MKILVAGDFIHEMYEKALYNAFKEMGEDVSGFILNRSIENNPFNRFFYKLQNRLLVGPFVSKLNKDLIEQVRNQKPDLVFLYRTPQIYAKTVIEIKKIGSMVFSYNNDDPFSDIPTLKFWRHYLKTAEICNHNFVYREKNIEDFKKIGIYNCSLLRSYYIKQNNFPIECDKIYDVVFLGHFENDGRDRYIKSMIDAGIKVTVFGDELWKEAPLYNNIKSVVEKSKRGKEYNETINRAKIALVFLSKINKDTYTRRCFEIPATKTLMMCEYTDDMASMFEPDKEAVYFNSPDDLVRKCKYLLEHDELIAEIAENGYNKLLKSGHEVTDRAKEIIKVYEQQRNN